MRKIKNRDVENFIVGSLRSIDKLTPNQPGEVVSPRSYLRFLYAYVAEKGGVVDQADLEQDITWHFAGIWGPDDLKPHRRTARPRWLNYLDWAKVMARKGEATDERGQPLPPIYNRRTQRNGMKFTLLALDAPGTDQDILAWVKAKTVKRSFKKKCRKCRRWVGLSSKVCLCGYAFPSQAKRTHKLPSGK